MAKTNALKRIVNCMVAEKRALHGEFKAYWKDSANKIAEKHDIDISTIRDRFELGLYKDETKTRSYH